ncbi:MAG: hypothetical protein ACFFCX_15090 [Candidatus Sifarchaeia archaeon]
MTRKKSTKSLALWFQILALLGLGLIPLIVYRIMMNAPSLSSQPIVVGLIFIVICLLGAVTGVRPSSFSRAAFRRSKQEEFSDSKKSDMLIQQPTLQGHHYTCDAFSDHVLRISNRVFCAGCTGLTTGAIIAILGSIGYFFLGILLVNELLLFWLGFTGVFFGLVQHHLYRFLSIKSGFFRFVLNVFFVLGAFFLLVGANRVTTNFAVDLYILCIILLWILSRVTMSSFEHGKICAQCDDVDCIHHLS